MKNLLIVGCGYVGMEFARLAPAELQISALTRSHARMGELQNAGIAPIIGDWLQAHTLQDLPHFDAILVAVPHREGGGDKETLGEQTHHVGLENLTRALPNDFSRLFYLSTTGVYGDCDDETVNEDTPVSPSRIGPKIAVQGERWLRETLPDHHTTLRLAGIYGPGRLPLAEKLRQGEPLAVPQEGFLNLVHVTDIARMILALLSNKPPRSHYVFSDGHPVVRMDFYQHLAGLCGVESPTFIEPDSSDSRSRRATSKRVDPSRIIRDTGFVYQYPDYRTGLAQSIAK